MPRSYLHFPPKPKKPGIQCTSASAHQWAEGERERERKFGGLVLAGKRTRKRKTEGKQKKEERGKNESRARRRRNQPEREMDSTEPRRLRERPARRRWASLDSPGGESPNPPVGGDGSGVSGVRGGPQRSSMLQASWCWTRRLTALALSAKAARSRALLLRRMTDGVCRAVVGPPWATQGWARTSSAV